MSAQDESHDQRPKNLIYDIRERVQATRNQVWSELIGTGDVHPNTKRELATTIVQYWDALSEFRDDRADAWEEHNLGSVRNLAAGTVDVPEECPGDTTATETVTRPAAVAADPHRLLEVSKRLDEFAKELGFSAPVSESEHRTKIDEELIREVEEWRQQNLE